MSWREPPLARAPLMPSGESRVVRWGRRLVTIPVYLGLTGLSVAALPLLAGIALAGDLARRSRRLPVARSTLFFVWYLVCESAGIVASLFVWIAALGSRRRLLEGSFALQRAWARALFEGGKRCFSFDVSVEAEGVARSGPYLLFLRHASVVDTVLPVVLLSRREGIAFRYVMKRELLWDPCLDIVGNRLPNAFVRRGSGESASEIRVVTGLLEGLGSGDGICLYPEGTRFTPARRERLVASEDGSLSARAASFRHVLPPRVGGALGLLEAGPGLDVVFCAHTGLEGARSFSDLLRGDLVGSRVRLLFWRVPAREIPTSRAERIEWLHAEWRRLDRWIGLSGTLPTSTT